MERWECRYDYPPESAATARLFERHLRQTATLRALLCSQYQRLLALYEAEVSGCGGHRK